MTLEEARVLLSNNNIPHQLCDFHNEAEYWRHTSMFPYTKNAQSCKVTVIVIQSNNTHKNIELQFNVIDGIQKFVELWFGAYSYEMFDCIEEIQADDLMDRVVEIMQGNLKMIIANDLKKKRWLGDACFDLTDDDAFGNPGFEKAMKRIQKKKGLWEKLTKSQKQYEIYDWNNYQLIIK